MEYILCLLGSAGGGGSSSGGGGGAFGLAGLMFFAGYAPMHFWGAWARKKYRDSDQEKYQSLQLIVWIAAGIYSLVWLIASIVSISFEFIFFIYLILPAFGSIIGTGGGLYNWFGKVKQSATVRSALQQSSLKDQGWDEERLTNGARNVFLAFQRDWSQNNVGAEAGYLTSYYHGHIELMIQALKQMNRQNNVVNPQFVEAKIIAVNDVANDAQDAFTIGFEVEADDQLIDISNNQIIFASKKSFTEFWDFYRDGNTWRLGGIRPSTAEEWTRDSSLQQFAANNGFYYSLDWGWLLLPNRGQLFSAGAFGKSDINNHCIGWFQSTYDKILTQIYTYKVSPEKAETYIIAQATLPRSYGNIVVRRRKGIFQTKISGLKEVSTEWGDFNKMYRVFATSSEQAASLELLNPKYMEQLAAVPFEINIEVVDRTIYIYAPLTAKNFGLSNKKSDDELPNKYQMLLWSLAAAFKEMKM